MGTPVKQYPYITIYGAKTPQNGFNNNGQAILCPTKCEIIEELNGAYSLTLEHPIDEYGIWHTIQVFSILKVQGQLFTIMNAEPSYTSRSGKITAYAEHIFYKQNDQWIYPDKEIQGDSVADLLYSARDNAFPNENDKSFPYVYIFDSDVLTNMHVSKKLTPDGMTKSEFIFDCINTYGGELYRDNFRFSINREMEKSRQYTFDIRIGLNLVGIKRTMDMTTFCTHFTGYAGVGNAYAISYTDSSFGNLPIPNIIARSKNFTYDTETFDEAWGLMINDTTRYFHKNLAPKITYTVQLMDVKNNPEYSGFTGIEYRVGDRGRLYDPRVGGSLELRIIGTKTNGITGEVTEVTFGDVTSFVYEGFSIPVPPFPEMPESKYDPGKIALILLDDNLQETNDVQYFTTLLETKQAMQAAEGNKYRIFIGKEAGVEEISERIFSSVTKLYSIFIPGSVKSIKKDAFSGCSNLYSVEMSDGLEEIGMTAFENSGVENIIIPKTVAKLYDITGYTQAKNSDGIFQGCTSLKSVKFSGNLQKIPYKMFSGCTSLTSVIMPSGLEVIGYRSFYGCTALPGIKISEGVSEIGIEAFMNCESLSAAGMADSGNISNFPSTIENIYVGAFNNSGLVTVQFPNRAVTIVEQYGVSGVFKDCKNLESVTVENTTSPIVESMFANCPELKTVTFSENSKPEYIGDYAFRYCKSLKNVSIPYSANKIGKEAFRGCESLEEFEVPYGVRGVGVWAFLDCKKLREIAFPPNTTNFIGEKLPNISVPQNYAFRGCVAISDIVFLNRFEAFPEDTYGFWHLEPFGAPDFIKYDSKPQEGKHQITLSGSGGFTGESGQSAKVALLKKLDENGVPVSYSTANDFDEIRKMLEDDPENIYEVEIGSQFNSDMIFDRHKIPEGSFTGLENIKSVYIPSTFTDIPENEFSGCISLEKIELESRNTTNAAPWGAEENTEVLYPQSATTKGGDRLIIRDKVTGDPHSITFMRKGTEEKEYNTKFSGIHLESALPEETETDTLYILKETSIFDFTLNGKKLDLKG